MNFFLIALLVGAVILLILAEYYLKTMYAELEFLRIENVALKLKVMGLVGGEDDQA